MGAGGDKAKGKEGWRDGGARKEKGKLKVEVKWKVWRQSEERRRRRTVTDMKWKGKNTHERNKSAVLEKGRTRNR